MDIRIEGACAISSLSVVVTQGRRKKCHGHEKKLCAGFSRLTGGGWRTALDFEPLRAEFPDGATSHQRQGAPEVCLELAQQLPDPGFACCCQRVHVGPAVNTPRAPRHRAMMTSAARRMP